MVCPVVIEAERSDNGERAREPELPAEKSGPPGTRPKHHSRGEVALLPPSMTASREKIGTEAVEVLPYFHRLLKLLSAGVTSEPATHGSLLKDEKVTTEGGTAIPVSTSFALHRPVNLGGRLSKKARRPS